MPRTSGVPNARPLLDARPDPEMVPEPEYRAVYVVAWEIASASARLSDADTIDLLLSAMEAVKDATDEIIARLHTVSRPI
jgi:hypothetical protein